MVYVCVVRFLPCFTSQINQEPLFANQAANMRTRTEIEKRGLEVVTVPEDGNCAFWAVSALLCHLGLETLSPGQLRSMVCDHASKLLAVLKAGKPLSPEGAAFVAEVRKHAIVTCGAPDKVILREYLNQAIKLGKYVGFEAMHYFAYEFKLRLVVFTFGDDGSLENISSVGDIGPEAAITYERHVHFNATVPVGNNLKMRLYLQSLVRQNGGFSDSACGVCRHDLLCVCF